MKIQGLFGMICAALVAFSFSAQAQVFSGNIVGYYNLQINPGNNLIANQLSQGGNTLDEIITDSVPEGATFALWNPTTDHYLSASTYDTTTGWSINYTLTYGQGGLLNTPSLFTNTFVGSVSPVYDINTSQFNPPLVTGIGTFLLSCYVPFVNASFYDVVGRNPINGESVSILNSLTQTTTTSTFNGSAWSNGDPTLNIGQSAFYTLLAPVPEPSTYALSGAGFLLLAALKHWRRR
jgi:hypothetical protein